MAGYVWNVWNYVSPDISGNIWLVLFRKIYDKA